MQKLAVEQNTLHNKINKKLLILFTPTMQVSETCIRGHIFKMSMLEGKLFKVFVKSNICFMV